MSEEELWEIFATNYEDVVLGKEDIGNPWRKVYHSTTIAVHLMLTSDFWPAQRGQIVTKDPIWHVLSKETIDLICKADERFYTIGLLYL